MGLFYSSQQLEEVKNQLINSRCVFERLFDICVKTLESFFKGKHYDGLYHIYVSKTGCYIVNVELMKKNKLKKLVKGLKLIATFCYQYEVV